MKGISNGPNSRPLNETIAESGPGLPDDAVGEGQLEPEDVAAEADRQAEALRRKWIGEKKR
jgi:hypothetical protein